ncbi:hypothetical protein V8C35DRAFT_299753 [Trichoderma chlorosporum]
MLHAALSKCPEVLECFGAYQLIIPCHTTTQLSSHIQSLACSFPDIPTAISWSSRLLRRSEGNMAGDAAMAALREDASKYGVSAGNEEFLRLP